MHTTDTTAAPFRVDAIYNPAIPGIYYELEIGEARARLRDRSGIVVDGLPMGVEAIDADGFCIPLSGLTYTTQQPPSICSVCGETKQVPKGSGGTGYGVNPDTGAKHPIFIQAVKQSNGTRLYFHIPSVDATKLLDEINAEHIAAAAGVPLTKNVETAINGYMAGSILFDTEHNSRFTIECHAQEMSQTIRHAIEAAQYTHKVPDDNTDDITRAYIAARFPMPC